MKKWTANVVKTLIAVVFVFVLFPTTASAANTTLGTPTDVQINKTWDRDSGKLVTSYGSVSWKPVKPLPTGDVVWWRVEVYRNGQLVGGHEFGTDTNYAASMTANQYLSYDLSPNVDNWQSGTYYFTVQCINRDYESSHNSSNSARSAEWVYTQPSEKLARPTGAKWAASSGYSLPDATWTQNALGWSHHVQYYYTPTKDNLQEGYGGAQWMVFGDSVTPYLDYGPGYYRFEVRTISGDLSKFSHSDWSEQSDIFHYKMAVPKLTVTINSVSEQPILNWKAVKFADYYEVERSVSASGSYTQLGSPNGTTFTDISAEAGRTYYYRIRACRSNGVKSDYATPIHITIPDPKTELKITTQPKSVTVEEGEIAQVTVQAVGDGLTYRWYYKNPGSSGYTYTDSFKGNTYFVTMNEARNGRQVLCRVYDQYGNVVQTNAVKLSMASSLRIVTQPKDAYTQLNKKVNISVVAVGDGLKYSWYVKDVVDPAYVLSSITSSTYGPTMTENKSGRYAYCIIADQYGNSVRTNTVRMWLTATVTQQPKSVTVSEGQLAKVTVQAVGDGLYYRWYYKNADASD